jgi:hypothetical protein
MVHCLAFPLGNEVTKIWKSTTDENMLKHPESMCFNKFFYYYSVIYYIIHQAAVAEQY